MNEITIGDKTYISSKRAAEITGYAKDYVGQLCREGHVDAKMVGRSWYVYEPSIRAHRFGADAAMPEATAEEADMDVDTAAEGKNEAENEQDAASEAAPEPVSAWERPKYTAEEPQQIPEIAPQSQNPASESAAAYVEPVIPAQETLTDMQAAWREWFERKQQALETPELEAPEEDSEAEDQDDEEEIEEMEEESVETEEEVTEIPLHRIRPAAPEPVAAPVVAPMADIVPNTASKAAYTTEYAAPQAPEARIVHERVITRTATSTRRAKKAAARTQRGTQKGTNAPMIAILIGVSIIAIAIGYIGSGFADKYLEIFGSNNPAINFLVGTREFNR